MTSSSSSAPASRAAALLLLCVAAGCAHQTWSPPPPHGADYEYSPQGFAEDKTLVVAASSGLGSSVVRIVASRSAPGLDAARPPAGPFEQAAPIDGVRFNDHLQSQGVPLAPFDLPATASRR